jgi:hypothetical protein
MKRSLIFGRGGLNYLKSHVKRVSIKMIPYFKVSYYQSFLHGLPIGSLFLYPHIMIGIRKYKIQPKILMFGIYLLINQKYAKFAPYQLNLLSLSITRFFIAEHCCIFDALRFIPQLSIQPYLQKNLSAIRVDVLFG